MRAKFDCDADKVLLGPDGDINLSDEDTAECSGSGKAFYVYVYSRDQTLLNFLSCRTHNAIRRTGVCFHADVVVIVHMSNLIVTYFYVHA